VGSVQSATKSQDLMYGGGNRKSPAATLSGRKKSDGLSDWKQQQICELRRDCLDRLTSGAPISKIKTLCETFNGEKGLEMDADGP
jgi:hypothetical protein